MSPPTKNDNKGEFRYVFPKGAPKMNSLDILVAESNAFAGMKYSKRNQFVNWINFFLMGVLTGAVAFGIDELEELLVHVRWDIPQAIMN
jgi:hypothetical protein